MLLNFKALPKKDVTERLKHLHIQCVGKIYSLGYAIRFDSLQDYTSAKFIRYPSYPWDEQQLWPKDEYFLPSTTMVLLGAPVELNSDKCVWENDLDLLGFSFLKDHGHQTLGLLILHCIVSPKTLTVILLQIMFICLNRFCLSSPPFFIFVVIT